MEITEVRIYPGSDLVKAYATINIDNCFVVGEIRVMQGPTGLFVLFPAKKLTDGTRWDIAFPADTETRRRIEQAILAEYEKVAARRRFISNHKKVSIKRHERESRKLSLDYGVNLRGIVC